MQRISSGSHGSGRWCRASWEAHIALGYRPGPEIGKALRTLLDDVIRDPEQNTREHLLERAQELKP